MTIDPTKHDYCHPTHAMRTKCACSRIVKLRGAYGDTVVVCACGRKHRKASGPGGSFEKHNCIVDGHLSTGKRPGGKAGCPGIGGAKLTGI